MEDMKWMTKRLVKSVSVYQPAVKIRVGSVWIDSDTGEIEYEEHPFLGIQVKIEQSWSKRFFGSEWSMYANRYYATAADLKDDGFRLDNDELITHDVLTWDYECDCAATVSSLDEIANVRFILGPETERLEWWEDRKSQAAEYLKRRIENKKA